MPWRWRASPGGSKIGFGLSSFALAPSAGGPLGSRFPRRWSPARHAFPPSSTNSLLWATAAGHRAQARGAATGGNWVVDRPVGAGRSRPGHGAGSGCGSTWRALTMQPLFADGRSSLPRPQPGRSRFPRRQPADRHDPGEDIRPSVALVSAGIGNAMLPRSVISIAGRM